MRKGSDYGPPMLLHRGVLVTTFAFLCFPAFAVEQDEPPPQPQNPPLSKEEIATSVKADSISIPTPKAGWGRPIPGAGPRRIWSARASPQSA